MKITVDLKKPWAMMVIITLLILLVLILSVRIVTSHPDYINNCSEAKARHLTNIPKSSVYYRPSLDRDNDGYACET